MKNFFIFLLLIQTAIQYSGHSQIYENFSDGDFTNSPAWTGETSNFIVNAENQLQLLAPAATGESHLTTSCNIINNAQWSFYVKLEFNPSSSNYFDVYLVADNENLKEALNGYFVRIGNSQDEVSLYKQSGDKSASIKIIDGLDGRVNASLVEINIMVTKDQNNSWDFWLIPS